MEKSNFNGEICYIEAVLSSIEFEKSTFQEQKVKLKEVLHLKLNEVYQTGIRSGERKIKSQLNNINYTE